MNHKPVHIHNIIYVLNESKSFKFRTNKVNQIIKYSPVLIKRSNNLEVSSLSIVNNLLKINVYKHDTNSHKINIDEFLDFLKIVYPKRLGFDITVNNFNTEKIGGYTND